MSASVSTRPPEADLARALAHPLRHRLLFEYQGEGASPSQAARRLGERLNVVSYHTRVLLEHGCVELIGTARRRGATEHFYRATVASGIDDAQWDRVPLGLRRAMIGRTLEIVWRDVRRARMAGGFDDPRVHVSRLPLRLDDEGMTAMAALLQRTVDAAGAIEAASLDRGGEAARPVELVTLCFGGPYDAGFDGR